MNRGESNPDTSLFLTALPIPKNELKNISNKLTASSTRLCSTSASHSLMEQPMQRKKAVQTSKEYTEHRKQNHRREEGRTTNLHGICYAVKNETVLINRNCLCTCILYKQAPVCILHIQLEIRNTYVYRIHSTKLALIYNSSSRQGL